MAKSSKREPPPERSPPACAAYTTSIQDCAAGKCCEREANAFSGPVCKNHGLIKSHCEPRAKYMIAPVLVRA